MIWTIVLWMAMQGHATSIQDIQVSEAEPQHCIVGAQEVSCTTGIPGVTEGMKRPAEWQCPPTSAEHVFEIRAVQERHVPCEANDLVDGLGCFSYSRSLWLDGKRLGIIKGLD